MEAVVEPDLVYPLIRGRDVKKWFVDFQERYVIIPHEPNTGQPIKLEDLKIKYLGVFSYLNKYREELKKRSIKPFLSLKEKMKKVKSLNEKERILEELDRKFYIIDNVGAYTFAPYKVVWKRIAGAITGKAVNFACAVVEPVDGRPVIPDNSTILVEASTPDEAYYIAGLLNSVIVRVVVASYTYELRQETHIVDVIKIPKFDPSNRLHKRIVELSRKAHELARCIHGGEKPSYCSNIRAEEELREIERELDLTVAQLLGISEDALKEFEKLYAILSGEEVPVEEEIKIPEEPIVNILNTLVKSDMQSYVEIDVVNPSGEEIEFAYELPWGRGSFRLVEGKYRVDIPPLKPGKYRGVVKWVWRGEECSQEFVIEVSEPEGPRRPRTLLDLLGGS